MAIDVDDYERARDDGASSLDVCRMAMSEGHSMAICCLIVSKVFCTSMGEAKRIYLNARYGKDFEDVQNGMADAVEQAIEELNNEERGL